MRLSMVRNCFSRPLLLFVLRAPATSCSREIFVCMIWWCQVRHHYLPGVAAILRAALFKTKPRRKHEATIGLVYKAMSAYCPASGLAHLVVAALFKKYRPQDIITRVELSQMLNGIKTKKGKDPAMLFEQISSIENKYNMVLKKIDKEDLISVVLDAARWRNTNCCWWASNEHSEQHWHWQTLKRSCRSTGDRQTQSENSGGDLQDNEIIVAIFDGFCFICKKKSHRADKCPDKTAKMNKRYQGTVSVYIYLE